LHPVRKSRSAANRLFRPGSDAPLRNAILRSNLADSAVADADIMRAFRADLAWYGNPRLRARAFLDFPFIP